MTKQLLAYVQPEEIVNIKDKSGKTLLHSAAIGGNIEAYKLLIEKIGDKKEIIDKLINVKDIKGDKISSPMQLAVQYGHKNMLEIIQQYGGDINEIDNDKNTLLHLAAKQNNPDIISELVKLGADVERKNRVGEQALDLYNNIIKNRKSPTNREIQRIFQDDSLIARIVEPKEEMKQLHIVTQDGILGNVERRGNRSRSTTLVSPNTKMRLYSPVHTDYTNIGILYDANKVLSRRYGLYDMNTSLLRQKRQHFYNIKFRKLGFYGAVTSSLLDRRAASNQNIISQKDFLKEYIETVTPNMAGPNRGTTDYNEVIANLYPEAMVGILVNNTTKRPIPGLNRRVEETSIEQFNPYNQQKEREALENQYYISEKYGYNLPIVVVSAGKVEVLNLDLVNIRHLLNNSVKLGFIIDKNGDITTLNKNLITFKEIKNFFDKTINHNSQQPVIDYTNKLLKVVKTRLSNDDLPTVDSLDNLLIPKEDIKN